MSDTEQSPKSFRRDSTFVDPQPEFVDGKTPFTQNQPPFLDYSQVEGVAGSSDMQKQPTAMDLIKVEDFILDPSTPRTPQHKQAEAELLAGPAAKIFRRHMDAVVKVYCTHSKPNFELPWQMKQQTFSKSTGFAVIGMSGDRAVLTNAHSVTYGIQVQLKKRGDDERFSARVVAVGNECDIALLKVDDEKFWSDIVPLTMSTALPELQESLCVLGYPIGGDSLAISAGVVSRVQMTHYSFGCMSLLALQTDAAINSGNSGGPVLNSRGDCVGIAFQSLTGDVQSIGYVIPASVCRHFLEDVHRHGIYTGFPSLNVGWQEMESKALKHAYKLGPHEKGILIRRVSEAIYDGELQTDDIILSIDGVDVGSDGTVPFRHGERLDFNFLITNHFVGDCAELIIMRGMERKQLKVKLQPYQHLVPPHIAEQKPSYFMCGGLVFTACSDPYLLQRYGALNSSPVRLLERAYFGTKSRMEEELVVLSNVLACQATLGYDATQGLRDSAVVAFNGQKVRNLVHLARMVSSCEDEFLKFDMEAGKKFIILERVLANQCTMEVIENHNMRASMSSNVEAALIERPKLDKS